MTTRILQSAPVGPPVKMGKFAQVFINGHPYPIMFRTPIDLLTGDQCTVATDTGELLKVKRAGDVVFEKEYNTKMINNSTPVDKRDFMRIFIEDLTVILGQFGDAQWGGLFFEEEDHYMIKVWPISDDESVLIDRDKMPPIKELIIWNKDDQGSWWIKLEKPVDFSEYTAAYLADHLLSQAMKSNGKPLPLDEREINEIKLCLYYADHLAHGTAGHNRMMLIAKLARDAGIFLDDEGEVCLPPRVDIPQGYHEHEFYFSGDEFNE